MRPPCSSHPNPPRIAPAATPRRTWCPRTSSATSTRRSWTPRPASSCPTPLSSSSPGGCRAAACPCRLPGCAGASAAAATGDAPPPPGPGCRGARACEEAGPPPPSRPPLPAAAELASPSPCTTVTAATLTAAALSPPSPAPPAGTTTRWATPTASLTWRSTCPSRREPRRRPRGPATEPACTAARARRQLVLPVCPAAHLRSGAGELWRRRRPRARAPGLRNEPLPQPATNERPAGAAFPSFLLFHPSSELRGERCCLCTVNSSSPPRGDSMCGAVPACSRWRPGGSGGGDGGA